MGREYRIRKILGPFSYLIATIFDGLGIVPTTVAILSFLFALITLSIFLFVHNLPTSMAELAIEIAIACIFLNALLGDVTRDLEERTRRMSEFGGPLGSFLDRYSDTFIVMGAVLFLKDVPWYKMGVFIDVGVEGHLLLGVLIVAGSMALNYLNAGIKAKDMGLEARSERMYLLSIFAAVGIFLELFLGLLFVGLVVLCISLYAAILHSLSRSRSIAEEDLDFEYRGDSGWRFELFHYSNAIFRLIIDTFRWILSLAGHVLRGIYHAIAWSLHRVTMPRLPSMRVPGIGGIAHVLSSSSEEGGHGFAIAVSDDETDGPVADAKVTLSNEDTGKIYSQYTDDLGITTFKGLEEGAYEIAVESEGYEKETRSRYIEYNSGGDAFALSPQRVEDVGVGSQGSVEEILEGEYSETKEEAKEEENYKILGESMLVEYDPNERRDAVVEYIAGFYLNEGRKVLLVSSQPSTRHYLEKFRSEIESGGVEVVNLPAKESITPRPNGTKEIPMTKLEYFSEVFEELSVGSIVIFEPLSSLILNIGIGAAYKFISQTLDRLSNDGISFIVFLNDKGHNREEVSSFENLFINLARVEGGELRKVGAM